MGTIQDQGFPSRGSRNFHNKQVMEQRKELPLYVFYSPCLCGSLESGYTNLLRAMDRNLANGFFHDLNSFSIESHMGDILKPWGIFLQTEAKPCTF